MKFSYNWLKEYIPAIPKAEKVAELLTMHSFEVEGIEKIGNDFIFSIDILPNRIPDASGHRGVAKELGILVRHRVLTKKHSVSESGEDIKKHLKVEVRAKKECPRYTARFIKNIKVTASPKIIVERLHACGINSINNVVDAGNYTMLDTGQPHHAFDADLVKGKIIVRMAKRGEKMVTLDNVNLTLDADDLIIADEVGPLGLAGIKGGKCAAVTEKTKNIILESANFDPELIQKSSKKYNLMTDAAVRFRAGLDQSLLSSSLDEFASLIQKMAGGEISKGIIDTNPKQRRRFLPFRPEKTRSVLGENISDSEMKSILTGLGFRIDAKNQKQWKIEVPSARTDVTLEENLFEEIGRIYGYENIPAKAPLISLDKKEIASEYENFKKRVQERIPNFGYSEIESYSFIGEKEMEVLENKKIIMKLENPIRPELSYIRPNLTISIIQALSKNLRHFNDARIFEIGEIFQNHGKKIKDTSELEHEHLALGFSSKGKKSYAKKESPFFELKGVITSLLESIGIMDVWFDDMPQDKLNFKIWNRELFHPFRSAQIKSGDRLLGIVGEIHLRILEKFEIKYPASAAEISLKSLFEEVISEREYKEISKYPAVLRDIAVLVPMDARVTEVADIIENTAGLLLRDSDLFDIYEGEEIPENKKSLAFSLSFESHERTLSEKEVDTIMQKIIQALESNPEWEVRK